MAKAVISPPSPRDTTRKTRNVASARRRSPSIRRCTQAASGERATAKKAAITSHVNTRRVSTTRYSARAAARTRPMVARMVRTGAGGRLRPAGRVVTAPD
jgi:hypothetical protein